MGDDSLQRQPDTSPIDVPPDFAHIEEYLFPTQQKQGTYNTVKLPPRPSNSTTAQASLGQGGSGFGSGQLLKLFGINPNEPISLAGYRGLPGYNKTYYPQEGGGWGTTPGGSGNNSSQTMIDPNKPNVNPAYAQHAEYAKKLLNPNLFRMY